MKAQLNRRDFLQRGAAAASLGLGLGTRAAAAPAVGAAAAPATGHGDRRPPNVLFINTDQQHADALSCLGNPWVHTPNLDRLYARSTAFRLSYSANPVCGPARCCWFTGRASTEHGCVWNTYSMYADRIPYLGHWIRDHGYTAHYYGKIHCPGVDERGAFDYTIGNSALFGQHDDPFVAEAAASFFGNYRGDKPFFLGLGFHQPHDNNFWIFEHHRRQDAIPYHRPAPEDLPPLPANFRARPTHEPPIGRGGEGLPYWCATEWVDDQWRYYLWAYYRMVEMVDFEIGRVLDALESSPHADNTVVIFAADHGEANGEHGMLTKGFCYDSAARVPLAISWPGHIPEGVVDDEHLVCGLDFAPTVCDYAGIPAPPKMRGYSLRPLLEDRAETWRDFVHVESNTQGRMIRTRDYKLIAYRNAEIPQLFDMRTDPDETMNLAEFGAMADTLTELRHTLDDFERHLEPVELKPHRHG